MKNLRKSNNGENEREMKLSDLTIFQHYLALNNVGLRSIVVCNQTNKCSNCNKYQSDNEVISDGNVNYSNYYYDDSNKPQGQTFAFRKLLLFLVSHMFTLFIDTY